MGEHVQWSARGHGNAEVGIVGWSLVRAASIISLDADAALAIYDPGEIG